MISDDKAMANVRLPRRAVSHDGRWWSDSQKLECVKTFLMTGNIAMSSRILKIPEDTVRRWVKTTWWHEIVAELRTQEELTLTSRLAKVVEKTLEVVEDRLDNGDFVYDQKTGSMRRKPVNMRDAHKVGLDLANKRELMLQRQAPVASEEQIDDKLLKLAKSFADIVNGRKVLEEPVDVEAREVAQDDGLPDQVWTGGGESSPEGVLPEEEGRVP